MTNQKEHIYLNRILSGDVEAFSYFVDTYQHMAYTIAVRIVQNREDAEDIVQEAFIKCYDRLPTFKGDSKFSTWLYRIVYHSALDAIRSQKRSLDTQTMEVRDFKGISDITGILDQLMEEDTSKLIKRAIQTLNPKQQTIITLYYYESQSLKEIAEIVAINISAVKVNLFRARKSLYLLLKDHVEFENRKG
ncbi:RNA polymerase sigma factor [Galbibacter sp.]|uniref:RNA polymerase sigma factor n=1 Tax=Galbibacter sp. TaxID=2918471 RepID=UPI003A8D2ED9